MSNELKACDYDCPYFIQQGMGGTGTSTGSYRMIYICTKLSIKVTRGDLCQQKGGDEE